MKKSKWTDPAMPLYRLVTKLAEETGEVAKAYNDSLDDVETGVRIGKLMDMRDELAHVIFIAETLRDNIIANIGVFRA